jgi:hypothetical protein
MRKTHFEQIPLEVIKEVLEENARQEKNKNRPADPGDDEEGLGDRHLGNDDGQRVG